MTAGHAKRSRRSRMSKAGAGDVVPVQGDVPHDNNGEGSSSSQAHEESFEYASIPTPTFYAQSFEAHPALITQQPTAQPAHILAKRATVVTVFSTQNATNDSTGDGSSSTGSPLPLGIIIGSVSVGVVLAICIVGGYLWWGHYGKKKHVKRAGRASAIHLNLQPTSPLSPGFEKGQLSAHPPRSSSKPGSSSNPIPTLTNRETPTRPSKTHERRGRGPPGRAAGAPSPLAPIPSVTVTVTVPDSTSSADAPPSTTPAAAATTTPTPNSRAKNYLPQKRSPLAASAPPREKPKEKPKVNEWARPLTPVSPGGSKDSHYGKSEDGHGLINGGKSDEQNGERMMKEPSSASHETGESSATTVVGSSMEDYKYKKSMSDDGEGLPYGDADPLNTRPTVPELHIPPSNSQPRQNQPQSTGSVPLPASTRSPSSSPIPPSNRTVTPTSAWQVSIPESVSASPSRSPQNGGGVRSASRASENSAWQVALPSSQASSPIPSSPYQNTSQQGRQVPSPSPSTSRRAAPSPIATQQRQSQNEHPAWQSPLLAGASSSPAPSSYHFAHSQQTPGNNGGGSTAPRAVSHASAMSNESHYYTGDEGDRSYMGAPGSAVSLGSYGGGMVRGGSVFYAMDEDVRESMIGLAYGGDEEEGVDAVRSPFEEDEYQTVGGMYDEPRTPTGNRI
ncbi:hypothetical protein FRB93_012049 [Tulasnella sp. JGI-2019a]|nr:hypothetical protein FRB93_012049 [Tulasnella sp. JGI-2019a]